MKIVCKSYEHRRRVFDIMHRRGFVAMGTWRHDSKAISDQVVTHPEFIRNYDAAKFVVITEGGETEYLYGRK